MRKSPLWLLLALGLLPAVACSSLEKLLGGDETEEDDDDDDDDDDDEEEDDDDDDDEDEEEEEEEEEEVKERGPMVTIPAGTLKAGTRCSGVPRITDEELVHPNVPMNEFSIDMYPYPNDPLEPPKTGVTRDEAEKLCEADGKRLCTELEWERACKGPDNKVFEYGDAYKQTTCAPTQALDARDQCVSAFGVKDMHGVVIEWTSSRWGRDDGGGLVTLKGNAKKSDILRERCAAGIGESASKSSDEIGFRCCSGPKNPEEVDLDVHRQPPLVREPSIDSSLAQAMTNALPGSVGRILSWEKLWRWHPRDNEELLLGKYMLNKGDRTKQRYGYAVFKVCGNAPYRITSMQGSTAKADDPGSSSTPGRVSARVETGRNKGELVFNYWYGSVKITEPTWTTSAR